MRFFYGKSKDTFIEIMCQIMAFVRLMCDSKIEPELDLVFGSADNQTNQRIIGINASGIGLGKLCIKHNGHGCE